MFWAGCDLPIIDGNDEALAIWGTRLGYFVIPTQVSLLGRTVLDICCGRLGMGGLTYHMAGR